MGRGVGEGRGVGDGPGVGEGPGVHIGMEPAGPIEDSERLMVENGDSRYEPNSWRASKATKSAQTTAAITVNQSVFSILVSVSHYDSILNAGSWRAGTSARRVQKQPDERKELDERGKKARESNTKDTKDSKELP